MDDKTAAEKLAALLKDERLGARSRWALQAGVDAADADSVSGILVIEIPSRVKDYLEVSFTAGDCDVVTRWGGGR